jgi:hypothetical protein
LQAAFPLREDAWDQMIMLLNAMKQLAHRLTHVARAAWRDRVLALQRLMQGWSTRLTLT